MSQKESSARSSRPRSRIAANVHDQQPTIAQLASLGIKARDFAFESTLPPVRTIYRQPRQIQPSVPRPLQREDTEPLDEVSQSQSRHYRSASDTEPVKNHSITREPGGFLEFSGSTDRIVNSQPFRLHSKTPEYSQVIQPLIASQETGMMVPTPTVTPNGSLQWTESPTLSEHDITPPPLSSTHLYQSLSGFSSPLASSPHIRRDSSVLSNRSLSMASLEKPSTKRRKISNR